MAKKKIRKTIRINGKIHQEYFHRREDADKWYREKYRQKIFNRHGISVDVENELTFAEYALGEWLPTRKKEFERPTWASDEQRLHDYVIPALGHEKLTKIRGPKVRALLNALVSEDHLSPKTRDRVRALISTIFNSAINHDPPLADTNPTFGLKFTHKRMGVKKPSHISNSDKTLVFLKAARDLGGIHLVYAGLFVMSGPRKQEGIALQWDCVHLTDRTVEYRRKYLQASQKIIAGTKAGVEATRAVPMSATLAKILEDWKSASHFTKDIDFVLTINGDHLSPGEIRTIHRRICVKAGINVTVHGLRHTFGREFAEKAKNLRALQEILGHSSFSTTQLYSELGKDRLKSYQDAVSFDLEDEQ